MRVYLVLSVICFATACVSLGMNLRVVHLELIEKNAKIDHLEQELASTLESNRRQEWILAQIFGYRQGLTTAATLSLPVTVTAYSAREEECNADPHHTADMTPARVGLLAVSRDLLYEVGLSMGETVIIPGLGVFVIHDKMNKRFKRRVDILHSTPEAAFEFGKREAKLVWLADS